MPTRDPLWRPELSKAEVEASLSAQDKWFADQSVFFNVSALPRALLKGL